MQLDQWKSDFLTESLIKWHLETEISILVLWKTGDVVLKWQRNSPNFFSEKQSGRLYSRLAERVARLEMSQSGSEFESPEDS